MIRICNLDKTREKEWDAFVEGRPEGTLFHQTVWKNLIARVFGFKPMYIYAERDGAIVGVLPLFQVPLFPTGRAFVSVPFGVYGGICSIDSDVSIGLLEKGRVLLEGGKGNYLELRQVRKIADDLPVKDLYVTFRREIFPSDEENMAVIPRKRRAMIREGAKNGLSVSVGGEEEVDRFYAIYSHSVQILGTPVFPKRFLLL